MNFFIINGTVTEGHDSNGLADPYITISSKDSNEKIKSIVKTPVKEKTLKLAWSYEINEDVDLKLWLIKIDKYSINNNNTNQLNYNNYKI